MSAALRGAKYGCRCSEVKTWEDEWLAPKRRGNFPSSCLMGNPSAPGSCSRPCTRRARCTGSCRTARWPARSTCQTSLGGGARELRTRLCPAATRTAGAVGRMRKGRAARAAHAPQRQAGLAAQTAALSATHRRSRGTAAAAWRSYTSPLGPRAAVGPPFPIERADHPPCGWAGTTVPWADPPAAVGCLRDGGRSRECHQAVQPLNWQQQDRRRGRVPCDVWQAAAAQAPALPARPPGEAPSAAGIRP